jgi:ABC-2 type transport system ATP-binding protein
LFYVGLGEARYRKLETYSLGMKQLAKLAQAIVHGPRLIFLDEPTNGLDPPARLRMIKLIREIRDSGQAHIVLSSHLLLDVEECCDEILILRDGPDCRLLQSRRRTKVEPQVFDARDARRSERIRRRAVESSVASMRLQTRPE